MDKYSQPEKLSPYQFCSSHHHQCCQQNKPGVCHDHPDYTDYSSSVAPRKILGFASLITKRRGALTFFAIMMVVMILDHHRYYHPHHIRTRFLTPLECKCGFGACGILCIKFVYMKQFWINTVHLIPFVKSPFILIWRISNTYRVNVKCIYGGDETPFDDRLTDETNFKEPT